MILAQGAKVRLRRLGPEDLDAFLAYREDPEVARYQSWEPMDRDQANGFLRYMAECSPRLRPGHWLQIAVADGETGALYGDMGLFLSADQREAELGITLARAAQGQGRAQEAVGLACAWLFEESPVQRIWGIADLRNTASLALLTRCGFVFDREEETDGLLERFTYRDRPA